MIYLTAILLVTASFCETSNAETCKVGEDGCTWDCRGPPPGAITCLAAIATPETCVVGSSTSLCGTTCTCNKSKAETCKVGEDGCTWDCRGPPPGTITCLAAIATPETCAVGSSTSLCGTTCTCKQQEKCKVGENCQWNCVTMHSDPDIVQCAAVPNTPSECYIGETSSMCGTTCTCTASTRNNNFLDRIRELLVNFLRRILGLRVTSGDACEK
ncbi:multiple epidermal growth factor-like domains protein 11 isoform X2 [Bradysia coprophila]|uniref:multiple epidermal growth factor-like domains protein 11 isoform X2 n=1 Tax=Bradysia coprophila TaxID=38358 RepID=UPI00187DD462|nr:multiple epidermal growth factor-like domains protein 11 isoform X2 [Bradysia coprophila]